MKTCTAGTDSRVTGWRSLAVAGGWLSRRVNKMLRVLWEDTVDLMLLVPQESGATTDRRAFLNVPVPQSFAEITKKRMRIDHTTCEAVFQPCVQTPRSLE